MSGVLEEQSFSVQWSPNSSSNKSETKNIAAVPWQVDLQNLAPVLSATIHCQQKHGNGLQWVCKAEIELTLKHPYDAKKNEIKTFEQIFSPERYTYNLAFGDMQDIRNDYMVDNKITVDVTIRVKKFRYITLAKLEEEVESLQFELSSLKKEIEGIKNSMRNTTEVETKNREKGYSPARPTDTNANLDSVM